VSDTELPPTDPDGRAPRLRLRVNFGDWLILGPGKTELLALIAETGSITASAARMGMSYRRAWMLVETMNQAFAAPVVVGTATGSRLTATGEAVLHHYRAFEIAAMAAGGDHLEEVAKLLGEGPARDA